MRVVNLMMIVMVVMCRCMWMVMVSNYSIIIRSTYYCFTHIFLHRLRPSS